MTKYSMGSLFAGVGGFDLGFEQQGIECRFQVEWDPHCQQTLAHHWPNVPRWSDVSDVNGAELPPVDIITYGFPCQDLSVAGKRAGLDGERSHLFFEAVRIIKEMREATNGLYPTWAVAENVAGLLNADGGSAMARVLDTLAEAGALVIEWVTLDAQWFGVPQRRRRVFVAACFDPRTADRCPDPLFPVAESGARNPAASDSSRQEVAGTLGGGSGSRGWSPDTDRMTFVPYTQSGYASYSEGFGTLAATDHKRPEQHIVPFVQSHQALTTDTLLARDSKDVNTDSIDTKLVVHETVAFVKAKRAQNDTDDTRTTTAIVFDPSRRDGARIQGDTVNTLTGHMGTGGNNTPMVAQTVGPLTTGSPQHIRGTETTDSGHIIAQPILSFDTQFGSNANVFENQAPTLKSTQTSPSVTQPLAVDTYNQTTSTNSFHTLRGGGRSDIQPHIAQSDLAVRRLTPLECERLMGWPDNHTLHRADGTTNSDSARYKQCGNGVVAPVAAWIAKHLKGTM